MKSVKISIIIPTYNRAHLIGETLDSIIAQTYTHWECIVVDDGSTDNTEEIMNSYQQEDKRIKYFHRSDDKPKGANSCRNMGIDIASGDFLIFFDSDDLMTPDHIETKFKAIEGTDYDYVITKTKFFNSDKDLEKYYQFDKYDLTPYNYVSQKINWLTYDICLKTSIGKTISFNEQLQSGQEYNYFSKLIHKSTNALFVNKVVTLRREHENSIRGALANNLKKHSANNTKSKWITYNELISIADNDTKKEFLKSCVSNFYKANEFQINQKVIFTKSIFKEFGFIKGLYFLCFISTLKFGRGVYYFYKKIQL